MKNLLTSIIILSTFQFLFAQNQVDISLLTDQILLVHIDEGHMIHATNGQGENTGTPQVVQADVTGMTTLSNYQLSSLGDPNYTSPQIPQSLNRKTKPTDFLPLCESFQTVPFFGVIGCVNTTIDHADEHWIYLNLPSTLQSGQTYDFSAVDLFGNGQTENFTFTFLEEDNLSEAIHVNNIAYSTAADLKYAYVYHWMGDGGSLDLSSYSGNNFDLVDVNTDSVVFSGSLQFRKDEFTPESSVSNPEETPNNNFLGSEVYECDFSSYNTAGTYKIVVDGIGASNTFDISCAAFRQPFESVMKGLFINRSGIDIDNPNAESSRPAPHNTLLTPGFAGNLRYSSTPFCSASSEDGFQVDSVLYTDNILGSLDVDGWYQDAGDWDAYARHMEVPIELMFTYEHFSDNFVDGQLNIPESGNAIPDILDEARWLLNFYKKLKDETTSKGYTTGGVAGGRIFGDLWGNDLGPDDLIQGSWQDTARIWVVTGEDPITTFYYAGVAAHFQHLLDTFGYTDPDSIDWEAEAIAAFDWANGQYSPSFACHQYSAPWVKNYASAALLRLTNNMVYDTEFVSSWTDTGVPSPGEIQGDEGYGAYIYSAISNGTQTASTLSEVNANIEFTADFNLINSIDDRSCRWGGNPFFPMIVGHGTTPYVFEGVMAHALFKTSNPAKSDDYLMYLHTTADYFLGTNPLKMTWISGLGERHPTGILHLDSWATGTGDAKPGIVPYGPWRRSTFVNMGYWDLHWPEQYVYPAIANWPGHERWFDQRSAPLTCEFTINQNAVTAAAVYGALSGAYDCDELPTSTVNIDVEVDCIEVFPNPSDDFFTVQGVLPNYDLTVVDVSGSVIMTIPNEGTQFVINTANLGTGMFFIVVTNKSNNNICVQKIISN